GEERRTLRHLQLLHDIVEPEHGEQIAKPVLGEPRAQNHEEASRMASDGIEDRRLEGSAFLFEVSEHRRLGDPEPDIETESNQYGREQEWDAPAPGEQVLLGQHRDEREYAGRGQVA